MDLDLLTKEFDQIVLKDPTATSSLKLQLLSSEEMAAGGGGGEGVNRSISAL